MDTKAALSLLSNDAEIVTIEELEAVLMKENRTAYIGFEPSGIAHLGQMLCSVKMQQLVDTGFELIVYLADWHAYVNDKLGGDMEKIKRCGEYLKDVFTALGLEENVRYVYASELMDDLEYWERTIKICKNTTLARIKRSMTIMGRNEDEADSDSSKLLYPALQVADIFALDVDVALGGMDQRHAHMLGRDVAPKIGENKFVAIHTGLISSLQASGRMDSFEGKMSKSKGSGTIFLHDSPEEISQKIKKGFCPQTVENNPVLEILRYALFPRVGEFTIKRPEKWGGDLHYTTYEELAKDYADEKIHPQDLKTGTAECLADALADYRAYFERKPENYEAVSGYQITR